MQNYLKYGKISQLFGINDYFAVKQKRKNYASTITFIFMGGGRGGIQLLVRVYSPLTSYINPLITFKNHPHSHNRGFVCSKSLASF